jgi:hypothetical protein
MTPILFPVEHIVDEVDRCGERAEDEEGGDGRDNSVRIAEPFGEHERREDEQVLRPLIRAQ